MTTRLTPRMIEPGETCAVDTCRRIFQDVDLFENAQYVEASNRWVHRECPPTSGPITTSRNIVGPGPGCPRCGRTRFWADVVTWQGHEPQGMSHILVCACESARS